MTAQFPVLPIAGSTLLRGLASLVALLVNWFKLMVRTRRHRREANALAGLDRRMLADIGISRADLNDAFSGPFWADPTALLRERAIERRIYRATPINATPRAASGFRRPRTDRPARQAI